MDYYSSIKELLIDNELTKRAKDYSKNKSDLTTYYNVGKLLSDAGRHYGEGILKKYSIMLNTDSIGKYNITKLKRMRQFYRIIEKGATMWHQLSWSHYRELLKFDDINVVNYYLKICVKNNLSVRELQIRIKNKEYLRLDEDTRNKMINNDKLELIDTVRNPILIRNNFNIDIDRVSERMLQKMILEDIPHFLESLGEGYSFIKNEYKIKIGNKYNYIDLLLFNIKYNCYVVVELKVTNLKKEHVGQIMVYMNYIDEHVKTINQNKTIGIIIVKEDNKFIIHYCNCDKIISREYELI